MGGSSLLEATPFFAGFKGKPKANQPFWSSSKEQSHMPAPPPLDFSQTALNKSLHSYGGGAPVCVCVCVAVSFIVCGHPFWACFQGEPKGNHLLWRFPQKRQPISCQQKYNGPFPKECSLPKGAPSHVFSGGRGCPKTSICLTPLEKNGNISSSDRFLLKPTGENKIIFLNKWKTRKKAHRDWALFWGKL